MPRGRKPKFTPEQEQAIARRYATGDETMSAIAVTLGVARALIAQILKRQGAETRHHLHALTPEQEVEVARRFTEGATARDLHGLFGVDHTTISRIVRERGGPLRRPGRRRHFNSRKEWQETPRIRFRKLLQTARSSAPKRGLAFDERLFETLIETPPTVCACCGVALDYAVRSREESGRAPSLDRIDNAVGYVVGNVYITCLRCNRLKNNATFEEIQAIAAYVERHRVTRDR